MVLWQKPLTIPSLSKFYHRSALSLIENHLGGRGPFANSLRKLPFLQRRLQLTSIFCFRWNPSLGKLCKLSWTLCKLLIQTRICRYAFRAFRVAVGWLCAKNRYPAQSLCVGFSGFKSSSSSNFSLAASYDLVSGLKNKNRSLWQKLGDYKEHKVDLRLDLTFLELSFFLTYEGMWLSKI